MTMTTMRVVCRDEHQLMAHSFMDNHHYSYCYDFNYSSWIFLCIHHSIEVTTQIFYVIKRDIIDAGPDEGFLYAQLLSKFCGDRECDERTLDMIDKIMENYRSGKN